MKRDLNPEEQRDELIGQLTEKHLAARQQLLMNDDKKTITEVCDSVLDYLSGSEALAELVIQSQYAARAVLGKKFVDAVNAVLRDDAECEAIREVERMEKQCRESQDDNRVARAVLDRAMSQ